MNPLGHTERFPTLFLPHGGGPWPLLDGPMRDAHAGLAAHLRTIGGSVARPRAVLLVSAHWEAPVPTLGGAAHPPMLYDYGGFPEATYQFEYPAAGSPEIAERAGALLAAAGIAHARDDERGFDHGAFVPMMVAYPEADVPIVQLSLRSTLGPHEHLALGRALAPLRDEGVLIAGSGMSFHNMRAFFHPSAHALEAAARFDAWLGEAMLEPQARESNLAAWHDAPGGAIAHPRSDHLAPLFVVAGAATGEAATRTFAGEIMGYPQSGFRFG